MAKLTPRPVQVAPRGYGCPGHTRIPDSSSKTLPLSINSQFPTPNLGVGRVGIGTLGVGSWVRMLHLSFHGGCSSGVERLTVAQEVAGSRPVTHPNSNTCLQLECPSKLK